MHRSRTTSHSSQGLCRSSVNLRSSKRTIAHRAAPAAREAAFPRLALATSKRQRSTAGPRKSLRLRETAKPFVQRTEGLAPWYHLCSPRLICRGLCGRSRLPTPCNGSTRLVLLGQLRPFFQLLGGLLEPGHHHGTCTVLPLALAAPFSTCPRQRIVSTVKISLRSVKGNSAAPRSPLPLPAASS